MVKPSGKASALSLSRFLKRKPGLVVVSLALRTQTHTQNTNTHRHYQAQHREETKRGRHNIASFWGVCVCGGSAGLWIVERESQVQQGTPYPFTLSLFLYPIYTFPLISQHYCTYCVWSLFFSGVTALSTTIHIHLHMYYIHMCNMYMYKLGMRRIVDFLFTAYSVRRLL